MTKGRVLLGVVATPHGVRGLVRIRSFTEDPMAIASYGALSDETGKKQYRVEALSAVGASRGSVMLPFTDEVVPEIDVEGGKVTVDPPAGVLAGGEAKEA